MTRKPKLHLVSSETFTVDWATAAVKQQIIEWNLRDGRQTMNLRTMPNAKLVVLKKDERIVGWSGFDIESNPEYPELFSLFLLPEFQHVPDLGLALSHIKFSYLLSKGLKIGFGRVQLDKNDERLQFRLKLGVNELVDPKDHPEWVSMCHGCELFGKTCTHQAYFKIHLEKFVRMARIKLGDPPPPLIPGKLVVSHDPKKGKSLIAPDGYSVKWAA